MGSVYRLTLRQLSGRWRMLITIVLASLPVVMALIRTLTDDSLADHRFDNIVINAMLTGSILPLVVLAFASAPFAHALDARTLANVPPKPLTMGMIPLPSGTASAPPGQKSSCTSTTIRTSFSID